MTGSVVSPAPQATLQPDDLAWTTGIRCVCMMVVLVYHAVLTPLPDGLPGAGQLVIQVLGLGGHTAVLVFVALSGYLLGRHWNHRLAEAPFGRPLLVFLGRRSVRMLPAYWVALGVTVLAMLFLGLDRGVGTHWDTGLPFTWTRAIIDALLVSDFAGQEVPLSHQLWTVPVEFHLYFLTPFIALLAGRAKVAALAAAGTTAIALLAPGFSSPFFFFAFATAFWLGGRSRQPGRPESALRMLAPVMVLAVLQAAVVLGLGDLPGGPARFLVTDTVFWCLLLPWLYSRDVGGARPGRAPWEVRLLSQRFFVRYGMQSYSFYLMHAVVLELVWRNVVLRTGVESTPFQVAAIIVVGGAATFVAAELMWALVEAPTMRASRRVGSSRRRAAVAGS